MDRVWQAAAEARTATWTALGSWTLSAAPAGRRAAREEEGAVEGEVDVAADALRSAMEGTGSQLGFVDATVGLQEDGQPAALAPGSRLGR